jgi:ribose transport system ATP-binding protein
MTTPGTADNSLLVHHLSVDFGSHRVLDDVSVRFPRNELHALLGPNGSGKSTLIKVLSGAVRPQATSEITLGDQVIRGGLTPSAARRLGLRFVHQDLGLLPELSVLENLYLGNPYPSVAGQVRWGRARQQAASALEAAGVQARLTAPLGSLRHVDQVLVAVSRCLLRLPESGGYLFLDEPTAALEEAPADRLLTALRGLLSARDLSVVLVSHRLREVGKYADGVTVLRDGVVTYRAAKGAPELNSMILRSLGADVGSPGARLVAAEPAARQRQPPGPAAVVLDRVRAGVMHDISLEVRPGEIVGIGGLEGSGKEELFDLLIGRQRPAAGTITLLGSGEPVSSESAALGRGVGIVPGNRLREGGISDFTVAENLFLPHFSAFWARLHFQRGRMKTRAAAALVQYGVQPPEPARPFGTLSGGNQQKTIVARWLVAPPKFLVLQEPTAGVDVASRERIYAELRTASAGGMPVAVISSDVAELVELCDRVLVMAEGRIAGELAGPDLTPASVTRAHFEHAGDQKTKEHSS